MYYTELKNWLRYKFYADNHPKYHKYFEEWLSGIVQSQLIGFNKQMFNDLNGILK